MKQSYTQIISSTAIFAMSSVATILFSIVRVKILAVLLGPAGIGLLGIYNVVADLAANLMGLGVQSSGVRQIAAAASSGDAARIARTAKVLNALSVILGAIGAVFLMLLAVPVSQLTFGSANEVAGMALLGLAVFFRIIAGAPTALLQGSRRVGDLSKSLVLGAFFSTIVALPFIYFFGEVGIVPSIVAMACASWIVALWYARKIYLPAIRLSFADARAESSDILKLGFAFMTSALLTVLAAYIIRLLILQTPGGIVSAGLYQAAWALGGLYAGFILQAMGTDFYPRLTGVADDNAECNRLVNEQAQVGLLLGGPGLLGTMTLAPMVMTLFYTPEFQPAISLLRWLCLGMLLRIIAWPLGFVILAKGAQKIFFWTEVISTVVNLALAWMLLPIFGLDGAGMAFVGLYLWHGLLVYSIVRPMTGFRFSAKNLELGLVFMGTGVMVFAALVLLPFWQATAIGVLATAVVGIYSMFELIKLVPEESFPHRLRPISMFISGFVTRRTTDPAE